MTPCVVLRLQEVTRRFVADFARPHLRLCFLSVVASRKSECVAVGVLVPEGKADAER